MIKNRYTPEMLEQIESVCKDPALTIFMQHESELSDINSITVFLKSICHFLKSNYSEIGALDYLLKLNFTADDNNQKLTVKRLLNSLQNDLKVIEINQSLSIVSKTKMTDFSNSGIAKYSQMNKCVIILVHNGTDLTIYVDGIPTKEINVNYPLSSPRLNKQTSRSSRDYRLSLIDFYNIRVKNNITNHWHDKPKRILKGGKTEDIFQDQLTNWLVENISDGLVIPKVKKVSSDETDIEIRAIGGNNYLIEIKWLGVNQGNTIYDETKIKNAIYQVKSYLVTDAQILDATIVVYDGRDLESFKKLICISHQENEWKELNKCQKETLPTKASCFVFFLISQSASQRKN